MTREERIEEAMVRLLAAALTEPGLPYQLHENELANAHRIAVQIVDYVDGSTVPDKSEDRG